MADLNGTEVNSPIQHTRLYEDVLYKFAFSETLRSPFYYYYCGTGVNFYCPNGVATSQGASSVDLWLKVGTTLEIYPDMYQDSWDQLDSYYTDQNWVYPYDIDVMCRSDSQKESDCIDDSEHLGIFLTHQSGSDYVFANDDMTVPATRTWSWDTRTLSYPDGGSLTVSGGLNATGTTLTKAGSSWDGVYFVSGSSGTLDNVTISGTSSTAITINNSSPTIRNSDITSSGKGISVSNGSSYPEIHNNDISTGSTYGIWFNDAGGYLYDNRITGSGNGEGVSAVYYANPMLDEPILGVRGYNEVSGYYWGLRAQLSSTMWTGAGYNCITASTYDAQALDDGTIYAEKNWWGTDGPQIYFDGTSYVDYNPYLTSDPCSASKAAQKSTPLLADSAAGSDLRDTVMEAKRYAVARRFEEAIGLFKSVIASDAESGAAATALIELGHLCESTKDRALLSYLQDVAAANTRHAATIKGSLIGCHRALGEEDRALSTARSIVREHPGSWQAFYGSLSELYIHLDAERYTDAAAVFETLQPAGETENEAVVLARELFEKESGTDLASNGSEIEPIIASIRQNDPAVQGIESYPNPFNPRTAIRFTLSEEARVRLAVFDLLGRELAVLVDEKRAAGRHEVFFDASDYATGTYLYRLSTPSASVSGMMQLVK